MPLFFRNDSMASDKGEKSPEKRSNYESTVQIIEEKHDKERDVIEEEDSNDSQSS